MQPAKLEVFRDNHVPCERNAARRPVTLYGFATLADGSPRIEITILDLSYDGCRIQVGTPLSPGTWLQLSVARMGALEAEVRWFDEGIAGLRFGDGDVSPTRPEKPRGHQRVAMDASISLRRTSGRSYASRLFDVTPAGCKIEFVERPKEGDIIWVKFDGLDAIEAQVRWLDGHCAGVEFNRPMHDAVFNLLLVKLGAG
jgi:hypothetical protein